MPWRLLELEMGLPYGSLSKKGEYPKRRDSGVRLQIVDGRLVGVNPDGSLHVPGSDDKDPLGDTRNGATLHTPLERSKGFAEDVLPGTSRDHLP